MFSFTDENEQLICLPSFDVVKMIVKGGVNTRRINGEEIRSQYWYLGVGNNWSITAPDTIFQSIKLDNFIKIDGAVYVSKDICHLFKYGSFHGNYGGFYFTGYSDICGAGMTREAYLEFMKEINKEFELQKYKNTVKMVARKIEG